MSSRRELLERAAALGIQGRTRMNTATLEKEIRKAVKKLDRYRHPRGEWLDGTLIPGSRCPECYSPMVYNGNYWCSQCEWILPEHGTRKEKDAFNVAYVLLMQQRGEEPDVNALE